VNSEIWELIASGTGKATPARLPLDRRQFLRSSVLTAVTVAVLGRSTAVLAAGGGVAFGFPALREKAMTLAKHPYSPPRPPIPAVTGIRFDDLQKINFRAEHALWKNTPKAFPVRFFHLHKYAPTPVRMNVVRNGVAYPIAYDKATFNYEDPELATKLPADLGFAGFRVMNDGKANSDWLSFQGASYFRASGEQDQYGISARGIALNTATETKEEFPSFTEFWLEDGTANGPLINIFALLEGPSVTGAYKFVASREHGATIDVHAELFVRNDVPRLGVAPLTSMYWFGENQRRLAADWRPEIHDSDGLAMWTGKGERIFRPLVNPPSLQINSFVDDNPKGFGLVQRDRTFANYQDDSAFYERRPSVWVEPKGGWGPGTVQLVEIPTDDEIHDNIVAFWQPRAPLAKGDTFAVDYRLHWRNRQPYPPDNVAQVVATRTGRGGIPGQPRPTDNKARKFVIDFEGGPLADLEPRYDLTPVVTTSRGKVLNGYVVKIVGTERWRAVFDVEFGGGGPLDLRCFVRLGDRTLTETWLYQYFPPSESGRG